MIQALCPLCRQMLMIPAEMAGQAMRCPHCGGAFQAPAATAIQAEARTPTYHEPVGQPGQSDGAHRLVASKRKPSLQMELLKIAIGGAVGIAIGGILIVKLILPAQQVAESSDVVQASTIRQPEAMPMPPPTYPAEYIRPSIPPANAPLPSRQIQSPQKESAESAAARSANIPSAISSKENVLRANATPDKVATPLGSSAPVPLSPVQAEPTLPSVPAVDEPANPFAGLAKVFKLPSPVTTTAQPVASFSRPLTDALKIDIDCQLADIAPSSLFLAQPVANSDSTWHVHYVADSSVEPPDLQRLGQMELDGRELRYVWDQLSDAAPWKQLANCQFILTSGEHRHVAQLREAKREATIVLDLDKAKDVRKINVSAPPKAEAIRLLLDDLVSFPPGTSVKGDKRILNSGQELAIEFTSLPGAAIEVKFAKQQDDSYSVILSPVFKERGSEDLPMTNKRLAELADACDKWLRESSSAIPALEREFQSLQSQVRSTQSRASSATGGAAVEAGRALGALTNKLDACGRKLKRLNQQVPEMRARQAAVPAVRSLLTSLHGKAQLHFKIEAKRPDGSALTLVELKGQQ